MALLNEARRILEKTESSLRDLIERALTAQQYGDVALLARIADVIANLHLEGSGRASESSADRTFADRLGDAAQDGSTTSARAAVKAHRGRRQKALEYPRFERDGEKLVKIGWSKRDDRVYEHRAPREVVFIVGAAISAKVKPKAVFTMEQVLPVNDSAGNEVPSYQAYLALAWLRSLGVVQRKGKNGYALTNGALDNPKLQRFWNSVPERP